MHRLVMVLLLVTLPAGCQQSKDNPVAPSSLPTPPLSGPRILLAGQSNAIGLRDCCLTDAIAVLSISTVGFWERSSEFAAVARNPELIAFVWWHGGADFLMSFDEYVMRLRAVITIARTSNPELPVRIVELPDLPERATVRGAQREVAKDAGVELVPTSDLPVIDTAGHYSTASYQIVKDRIYRSLGR